MTWRESVRTWWRRRRDLHRELVRLQGVEAMLRVKLRATEEARDAARAERDAAKAAAETYAKHLQALGAQVQRLRVAVAADAPLTDAQRVDRVRRVLAESSWPQEVSSG